METPTVVTSILRVKCEKGLEKGSEKVSEKRLEKGSTLQRLNGSTAQRQAAPRQAASSRDVMTRVAAMSSMSKMSKMSVAMS